MNLPLHLFWLYYCFCLWGSTSKWEMGHNWLIQMWKEAGLGLQSSPSTTILLVLIGNKWFVMWRHTWIRSRAKAAVNVGIEFCHPKVTGNSNGRNVDWYYHDGYSASISTSQCLACSPGCMKAQIFPSCFSPGSHIMASSTHSTKDENDFHMYGCCAGGLYISLNMLFLCCKRTVPSLAWFRIE